MISLFTEGFFKNVIGFATILLISIGITAMAAPPAGKSQTAQAEEVHK